MESYEQRGYLNSNFRLFHLTDIPKEEFAFHYHDFDKLVIFRSGKVTYMIEGRSYELSPYDIVFVPRHLIHRPKFYPDSVYDRIIIYLSPDFLTAYQTETCDLGRCLEKARQTHAEVLRIPHHSHSILFESIKTLEQACSETGYANELHCRLLFLEFMIQLNRSILNQDIVYLDTVTANEPIQQILLYLNEHLTEPNRIDELSQRFHLSRYHMMRLFKQETGYSIGDYLTSKRLILARTLLEQHYPITEICYMSGFSSYSTFSRAYKAWYGKSPRDSRFTMSNHPADISMKEGV